MSSNVRSDPGGLVPGEQLAGYQIREQIGRGGMAVVYRALDLRLGRTVALKVLAPDLGDDQAFRQRFIRESRAAAGVEHPHIVPVFEAGEADGVLFIAMRYVGHGDVRTLIQADGRLSAARAAAITGQVASALDAAHAHGLVHRDVKPGNILLGQAEDDSDHAYLADFGLSKHSLTPSTLTSTGQFLGTLDYVSPEQIQGRPVDGRADQYALACTAVEMLTGAPPFCRDDTMALMFAQLEAEPPKVTERRPELSPAVDDVIAAAMAKSPAERYPTCRDFAMAFAAACAQSGWAPTAATDMHAGRREPPLSPAAPSPYLRPQIQQQRDRSVPTPEPRDWPAQDWPPQDWQPPDWSEPSRPASAAQQAPADAAGGSATSWPATAKPGASVAGIGAGPEAPGFPTSWSGLVSEPDGLLDAARGETGRPAAARLDADYGGGFVRAGSGRSSGVPQGPPPGSRPARHGPDSGRPVSPAADQRGRTAVVAIVITLVCLACVAGIAYKLLHRAPVATPPSAVSGSTSATAGEADRIVREYFGAINRHRYLVAWKLSGEQEKFATFEAGFAGTAHDAVRILKTNGNVVTASLFATQTDGTVKTYRGTYTVTDGTIGTTDVRQTG